ncbi:hypothetical protein M7I_4032 [Glarea lozoyensis 74030]|uniref:Uncharacterized protein n=1 Tax=Glarea lozoyensis (strain ATCC 74030 / MF5533) TaxID=1104152 RepID=H0EN31_GLAL7|nr:hypothetical protein M7I_4032 [Glarea lozoyensis 74030]
MSETSWKFEERTHVAEHEIDTTSRIHSGISELSPSINI